MMKKVLLLLVLSLVLSFNAMAEVSFEAGVSVEKEAENSAIAKEEALKDAYRQAFLNVTERLTTKENVEKLAELTDEQLILFVQETNVVAEKSTGNLYRADLNIKINGELLKAYMLENEMIEVVAAPADILIIPTYADTQYNGSVLFEDGNIWRQILLSKGHIKAGSLNFDVIADNFSNKAFLTADNVLHMSEDTFEKIKFINNAQNVFTVHAVRAGQNSVVLLIKSYNTLEKRIVVTDDQNDPFEKAIQEMIDYIYNLMRQKNVDESGYQSKIYAVFEYEKLKDWLELQARLNNIPQIKNIETCAMDSGKVAFGIDFSGSVETLIGSLESAGFSLTFDKGKYIIK